MRTRNAFTLAELLVVIAIIIVLAGIIWAVLGPARERARQMICLSHLHQIGIALSMYRQDYDGISASKGIRLTSCQLGLPVDGAGFPFPFISQYIKNQEILYCPDGPGPQQRAGSSYGWGFADPPADEGMIPIGERFEDKVASRGENVVLVSDVNHNSSWDRSQDPPWDMKRVIVLRLNNQVSDELVSSQTMDGVW